MPLYLYRESGTRRLCIGFYEVEIPTKRPRLEDRSTQTDGDEAPVAADEAAAARHTAAVAADNGADSSQSAVAAVAVVGAPAPAAVDGAAPEDGSQIMIDPSACKETQSQSSTETERDDSEVDEPDTDAQPR